MYEAVAAGQTASDEGGALEHSQAIPKEAHATGVRRIPAAARSIIVLWTASRVAVVLLGWLMSTRLGWHRVLDPWQRQPWTALTGWDSVYYIRIAHEGYAEGPRVAFFSLYPLLIRGTEAVTGLGDAVASLAVSNIAALIGMMGIYVLGRDRLSPQHAWRAVLYLVLSPYAFALVLA
ncbi:MAG TPA: mannosyltransferase family protein, partial [Gaiellales bacterium]|nr:mannosyltransferase family protein [Gaiellales bacterium]